MRKLVKLVALTVAPPDEDTGVWVQPEHVTLVQENFDGTTMVWLLDGRSFKVLEKADKLALRLYEAP